RYGGIARLYGAAGLARLRAARVAVAGLGGVGSWAVEALARSGVGHLRLIDLDHVAESNINRQIHALEDTLGQAKVVAMAERIARIDPGVEVACIDDFVTADNVAELLAPPLDYVIDAIDDVRAKAALLVWCQRQGIALVTVGGAGGKTDPARVQLADLGRTTEDPLLAKLRARLRSDYGYPRGAKRKFHVDAVFSPEIQRGEGGGGLNCAGFGSSMAVTASYGLVAAGRVIDRIARGVDSAGEE
ncbi:MAG: tRNA threonylcarbamoyladenosine dehydratase, partial [Rhodocyclaceae bacterium]|nr:tRNA threonylcarbamoyladenosine dehydratase [Rhodocyclaceae bacterium]